MAKGVLLHKIHDLSDLELAVLLSLTAQEHCIIDTEPGSLDELVHELRLVSQFLVEIPICYRLIALDCLEYLRSFSCVG
jgi:hypothetical protein